MEAEKSRIARERSMVRSREELDKSKERVTHLPIYSEPDKEKIRHIDIIISNEDNETVFKVGGTVSRKTAHKFMENVGYAFIPQEPISALRFPTRAIPLGKISCENDRNCTVYPNDCAKCGNNKAKSYFKPKEKEG